MIKDKGRIRTIVSIIIFSLSLSSIVFLASCSDSERNQPYLSPVSTVLINLGNKSGKSAGRMEASMPADITSITITVTGAGMAPITRQFNEPADTVKELTVPSGAVRNFTAIAQSPSVTYVGNTVATLPANQTVSVPIVMVPVPALFANEGSPTEPIYIEANTLPYIGQVGTGRSYYYTNPSSYQYLNINMLQLTDDADLISFTDSSDYSSPLDPLLGQNYCGRTKDEMLFAMGYSGNYYFVVDGNHTKRGAAFVIDCTANDGTKISLPPGTMAVPLKAPVGLTYYIDLLAGVPNYFTAFVEEGKQHWINLYEYFGTAVTTVSDSLFYDTPNVSNTFIPDNNVIFFNIQGDILGSPYIEIVASEGTQGEPVELFPSASSDYGRANFCMAGALTPSYYRFPVNPSAEYLISLSSATNNINWTIYNNPDFTNNIVASFTDTTGNEQSGGNFTSGYIYIRVEDAEDVGSDYGGATFILYITPI